MSRLAWLLLGLIICLSVFLSFYRLGKMPPSLDWDEASIGWNAYSILKTGTDEYGTRFPVSFRSFNDYKPPLYIYSVVPSIFAFGLTEYAIRFPSALAGVLTVIFLFIFVKELFDDKSALIASLCLAVTPWHLQFSRVAFEANLALFFLVAGLALMAFFLKRGTKVMFLLSVVSFALSIYSYHSSRILVPLLLCGIALCYRKIFFARWRTVISGVIILFLLLAPLIISTFKNQSLTSRFGEVSIFSPSGLKDLARTVSDNQKQLWELDKSRADFSGRITHGRYLTLGKIFLKNYLDHFNFDFLFLIGDDNPRHHAPDTGVLLLWQAPFILFGLYLLMKNKSRLRFLLGLLLIVAPIASALTSHTPHAVRSLPLLIPLTVLCSLGIINLNKNPSLKKLYWPLVFILPIFLAANVIYYFHMYFTHGIIEQADSWQYGYKEAVTYVQSTKSNYKTIYITKTYDQPYIYFLLYGNLDPAKKNPGNFSESFANFTFISPQDFANQAKKMVTRQSFSSDLFVLAPDDLLKIKHVQKRIDYPNGKTAFIIGTDPSL